MTSRVSTAPILVKSLNPALTVSAAVAIVTLQLVFFCRLRLSSFQLSSLSWLVHHGVLLLQIWHMAVYFSHPVQPVPGHTEDVVYTGVEWHDNGGLLAVASKNGTSDADGTVCVHHDEVCVCVAVNEVAVAICMECCSVLCQLLPHV